MFSGNGEGDLLTTDAHKFSYQDLIGHYNELIIDPYGYHESDLQETINDVIGNTAVPQDDWDLA